MLIKFYNSDIKFRLKDKSRLAKFLVEQVQKSGKECKLSYVFCSDDYLLDINRRFLKHDYFTDIVTFPLSEGEKVLEGEIYISVDRVKDNAEKLKVKFEDELHRVIFHGVLHLLGFKDKNASQKATMRLEEDKWLKRFAAMK